MNDMNLWQLTGLTFDVLAVITFIIAVCLIPRARTFRRGATAGLLFIFCALMGNPGRLPPEFHWPLLVVVACLVLTWLGDGARGLRKTAALFISLAAALYLCIAAIIAVPEFSDQADRLKQTVASAATELDNATKPLPAHYKGTVSQIAGELETARHRTSDQIRADLGPTEAGRKADLDHWIQDLEDQDAKWNEAVNNLVHKIGNFDNRAEEIREWVKQFFLSQNQGRMGAHLTELHGAELASGYWSWLSNYVSSLVQCQNKLNQARRTIDMRWNDVTGVGVIQQRLDLSCSSQTDNPSFVFRGAPEPDAGAFRPGHRLAAAHRIA